MDGARPRLGVLGGSFDPPHLGHLVIASEACARRGLERVLFTPAAAPPHKIAEQSTPAAVRLEMTALAIADDRRFAISEVEVERGLVYTCDTIKAVAADHPEHDLVFIMGSDSLLQFAMWHEPDGILALCSLAVALRPGDDRAAVSLAGARWGARVSVLEAPMIGVSSSAVRARVAKGQPIRYLVPPAVETLVRERSLYGTS